VSELAELVISARDSDLDAYGEIVRRFQDMAYGYAYSLLGDFHLAEDAAQEAFIEAYRCLRNLREPAAFPGWFRRIVFKHCDRIRRRRRLPTTALESAEAVVSAQSDPASAVERNEMAEQVLAAIRSLPEDQRTVTTLFYINGYSQRDVAEFLDWPVTTVNNRLHAARKKLKERMIAMIAGTLKSNAPDPNEVGRRVAFLLEFGQRIGKGESILQALADLEQKVSDERLRGVIRHLQGRIAKGKSFSEGLAEYKDLFPPMVVALMDDGERFGILDATVPLAAEWLRAGEYSVAPHLFAGGLYAGVTKHIKEAMGAGATEVVFDSTHRGPHPRNPRAEVVWVEHEMPDGQRRKADYMHPGSFPGLDLELKNLTILDEHQKGDTIRGTLRLRLDPADSGEMDFPIAYRPFRDGDEIRVRLRE
jgi:RNA polymerase sigma factor (sigma-70 family)